MTRRRPTLPPAPKGCSSAPDHDSRGPGWYCCKCNTFNNGYVCWACGHRDCR
jgi:hypothetical protein